jgi:hypothetical protein
MRELNAFTACVAAKWKDAVCPSLLQELSIFCQQRTERIICDRLGILLTMVASIPGKERPHSMVAKSHAQYRHTVERRNFAAEPEGDPKGGAAAAQGFRRLSKGDCRP